MKKIIIGLVIFIAIALLALFIFALVSRNQSETQVSKEEQEEKNANIPPSLPHKGTAVVDEDSPKQDVTEQLLSQEVMSKDYSETSVWSSRDNSALVITDFADNEDIRINDKVLNNIKQSQYEIISCCKSGNDCDRGILLYVAEGGSGQEIINRYNNINTGLVEWEKSMAGDLKNVLFPDSQISTQSLPKFNSTRFETASGANNIEIKYINFKDQSGRDLSLNFAFFDNLIFILNDKDCIRTSLNKYEDVLEP